MMYQGFRGIPKIVWVMIIGSGISRGAFFMAFPFLALHLKNHFGTDITTIGWIIGAGPLMGALVGFYGGYLSDIFGRRTILITSLIAWGCTQIGFSFANSVLMFTLLSALNGILRAISDPVIQAVISEQTEGDARERAYHYRYFAINIGGAIGPLIGSWILLHHPTVGFSIAGLSLILFALAFAVQPKIHFHTLVKSEKRPGFWPVMKILMKDRVLNCFVLASILCALSYSQMDAALPIILNNIFGEKGVHIFGWTMAVNGTTIIIFQLGLNKITKHFNTTKTVAVSCLIFALGFAGFAFSSNIWWAYIVSMVILSLGEILVFSNGNVLIDRLAPDHLRGTYHSASNLFAVGFAFGPFLGGWLLKHTDQQVLFVTAAILLVFSSCLYLLGNQITREKR
jgi:MFS family permease